MSFYHAVYCRIAMLDVAELAAPDLAELAAPDLAELAAPDLAGPADLAAPAGSCDGGGDGGGGGGGGGGGYQLRFERVPLATALDEATWQGLHKRYWRFPCYLAPIVTRVAAEAEAEEQGLGPLFEGHPVD